MNNYHETVRGQITPLLESNTNLIAWLTKETQPIPENIEIPDSKLIILTQIRALMAKQDKPIQAYLIPKLNENSVISSHLFILKFIQLIYF